MNISTDGAGNDLVTETIAFWQKHSGVEVSPDDAREMIENLSGFFNLLDQWDQQRAPPP